MASKKPKGLTITRKKNKYILAWKKGETYGDGQRLIWGYTQVTKNGSKSTKTKWESSTVKLSASKSNYTVTIPSTYTDIANVYFKIRGKADNKEWSAWENETFKLDVPKPPTVTAEWNSESQNKTTFYYTAKDEDHQPYDHIVYQSILVSQCPDNYKIESMWADAYVGELGGTSGSIQMTDSSLVGSQARIIRMKTVGQGGSSAWRYAHHVYASPYAPENVKVTAEYNEAWQYTDITVTWSNTIIPMQAPIDKTTVEYTIGVPTADDGLPTGASWTEMTPLNPVTEGAWQGRINSQVAADECLFVRVVNTHDNWTMYNVPVIAYRAKLTSPTISSVTPNSGTHTIQVVLALGTANPDAKAAITYRDPVTGVVGVLGIATAYGTYNVVVPAWTDNPGNIGAYNFVGESALQTTKADGTKIYSVEPIVTSDTVWNGTPTAPTITAVRKDEETVTVSWNWPWDDATNAEISWADRPDAWESTAQPQTYEVANFHAATWNIGDLEQGKTWYFRVRLFYGENDTNIYGEYSNTVSVNLSSAPDTPVITLSDNVVKREGSVTVSWVYTSTDGTRQSYAEIYERHISGELVYDYLLKTVTSGTSTEINVEDQYWWGEGYKANIAVKVFSESGQQSGFSNMETVTIAEPLACTIAQDSLVYDEVEINPETVTGDPAHFDGGQDNIKEVTSVQVPLEPHQAGTPWQDSTLYKTPFLFKPTQDVSHSINSKYTTLVGADVAVNQIIPTANKDYTSSGTDTRGYLLFQIQNIGSPVSVLFYIGIYTTGAFSCICKAPSTIGTGIRIKHNGSQSDLLIYNSTTDSFLPNHVYVYSANIAGADVQTAGGLIVKNQQLIDLTQMLGTTIADTAYTKEQATAGSGIAWLKANGFDFSKYRAYNAGSLESVNPSAIVTRGFNQWDEEIEEGTYDNSTGEKISNSANWRNANPIKVLPSTAYYTNKVLHRYYYDANMNFVSYDGSGNNTFTTPSNAYYLNIRQNKSSWNGTETNINLHYDGSRDGEYEQYKKNTYSLGNVPLHGVFKLVDGDIQAVGDTRDAGGNVGVNFGQVDLGTLSWNLNADGRFSAYLSTIKPHTSDFAENLMCARFVADVSPIAQTNIDNTIACYQTYIYVYCNTYTTVADFKTAMNGVMLIYELATPTTDTADPFTSPQVVDNWGTEEFTTENDVPVGNNTRYADVYEITGTDEVTVTVADDPDNPTTSDDYTTALGQTVYEGTVDVVKGKITVTRVMLDAAQIIAKYNAYNATYNRYVAYMTGSDNAPTGEVGVSNTANAMSDQFTCDLTWNQMSSANAYPGKIGVYHNEAWDYTRVYIYLNDSDITTKEQAEAFLTSIDFQLSYDLADPIEIDLTPTEIEALLGDNYVWSEQGEVTVRIADAVESGYYLDELPLTVTVTGAGNEGDTTMKIVRAENYAMERPDGKDYNGYEGDLIVARNQAGEDQMSIDLSDLVGRFDDGAKYRIIATTQDQFGQSAEATKDFVVRWSHQAVIATGSAVIDGDIAKITPTKPDGALDSDMVDIYRLSADAPVLIYEGAEFGVTYVDPYPTIGEMGGYRLVLRTKNGDYITENDIPSWTDITTDYDVPYQYIDFDGNRLGLEYNVDLDESTSKIQDVTHYLGGAIQGDSIEGVEGSGNISASIPFSLDQTSYRLMRALRRHVGICHVRTKIGSNYTAMINVDDKAACTNPGSVHTVSLSIQQVDNPTLDGVPLTDWQVS